MNTNIIQVITTLAVSTLIAGLAGVEVTGDLVAGATAGLSYLVVATLIVMVASDYRSGPKAYFVSPVVTAHFKGNVPPSAAQRSPGAKSGLAA